MSVPGDPATDSVGECGSGAATGAGVGWAVAPSGVLGGPATGSVGGCASGAAAGLAWPFYAGVGAAASHLAWQVADVDLNDRDDCAAKFKSNSVYGGIVFAAIVAGKLAA